MANTPAGASQAPNTAANGFNANACNPRLIMVDDAMSLTRANITGWNQSDIESVMFKEVGLDKVIAQTKEARMAGSAQRTLMDLLLSRHTPLKVSAGAQPQSIIQPFDLVPRRNRVNPGYFRLSAGAASTNADLVAAAAAGLLGGTSQTASAGHWTVTVNNGSLDADSSWLAKSPNNVLKNIEKFFLPRHGVTVEWSDPNSGAKYTSTMHVVGAFNVDANQAKVILAPNRTYPNGGNWGGNGAATGTWYDSATTPQKAAYQPVIGIVRLQSNSVSNFESYGNALPGFNEWGLVDYWPQTTRRVHKYNAEYLNLLKAAAADKTSAGLAKFRLLPLAQLRKQQEAESERQFFETCFYGDAEDENQTTQLWQNLPTVYDPAWAASGESGTMAIEYRTRTIGIRNQIALCGNVLDAGGGPLDLDAIFEAGYYLRREREGESGQQVTEIDCMTDMRGTRPLIRQIMTKYYKQKYSIDNVSMWMEQGKKITFNGAVLFEYDSYELPEWGYTLNVFSDLYFDDRISQFQNSQKTAGYSMWFIDWSDIAVALIKAMSVTRTANSNAAADAIYGLKYVMEMNMQSILMESKKFSVRVGNSNRHRIIENYNPTKVKLTVPGVDLSGN